MSSTLPSDVQERLDEIEKVRERLTAANLLTEAAPARAAFDSLFQLSAEVGDALLAALVPYNRWTGFSASRMKSVSRLSFAPWRDVIGLLESTANRLKLPFNRELTAAGVAGPDPEPFSTIVRRTLLALALDAALRQAKSKALASAAQSSVVRRLTHPDVKTAAIEALLILLFISTIVAVLALARHNSNVAVVNFQKEESQTQPGNRSGGPFDNAFGPAKGSGDSDFRVTPTPTPRGSGCMPVCPGTASTTSGNTPVTVDPASFAGATRLAVWLSFGSLLLVALGVILVLSTKSTRAKAAGALLALSGFSLMSVKDFKVFGSLIEKVEFKSGFGAGGAGLPVFRTKAKSCIVKGFPEGKDGKEQLMANASPSSALSSAAMPCVDLIRTEKENGDVLIIAIIGHVDWRELRSHSSKEYGTNLNLAYKRALAAKNFLTDRLQPSSPDDLSSRILVLAAGPTFVGPAVTSEQLESDRSVEVVPYWTKLESPAQTEPANGKR